MPLFDPLQIPTFLIVHKWFRSLCRCFDIKRRLGLKGPTTKSGLVSVCIGSHSKCSTIQNSAQATVNNAGRPVQKTIPPGNARARRWVVMRAS
jgi:hypothetical protein